MNTKLVVPLAFIISLLTINISFSQNNEKLKPLPLVSYSDNVLAPLTPKEKQQILEVYGDQAETYIFSKPNRQKDIKHLLRNRIEIKLISNPKDQKKCALLSEVPLLNYYVKDLKRDENFNPQTFNPLKYLFNFYSRESFIYRVDNSDYFIYIKSQHLQ